MNFDLKESIKNKKKILDYDLISLIKNPETSKDDCDHAWKILIKRYEPKIYKDWERLQRQLNNSVYVQNIKDEYFEEAMEAFYNAICKIDLSKVKNDKWKAIGYVDFYLKNVRTKLIKQVIKAQKIKSLNEKSIKINNETSSVSEMDVDVESIYYRDEGYKYDPLYIIELEDTERECEEVLSNLIKNWDPSKREIFALLRSGIKRAEIARKLNINVSKVYNETKKMRSEIEKALMAV